MKKFFIYFIFIISRINHNIIITIIIWTGYTKQECEDLIYLLRNKMNFKNIIIKYGRYIPNQTPHYDEVLGVKLASDNQYAERL